MTQHTLTAGTKLTGPGLPSSRPTIQCTGRFAIYRSSDTAVEIVVQVPRRVSFSPARLVRKGDRVYILEAETGTPKYTGQGVKAGHARWSFTPGHIGFDIEGLQEGRIEEVKLVLSTTTDNRRQLTFADSFDELMARMSPIRKQNRTKQRSDAGTSRLSPIDQLAEACQHMNEAIQRCRKEGDMPELVMTDDGYIVINVTLGLPPE